MANCRGNSKLQINIHNNHPKNCHIIYQTHCKLVHLDGCFILVRAVVILSNSMIWKIRLSVRTILNLQEGFLIFPRESQHTGLKYGQLYWYFWYLKKHTLEDMHQIVAGIIPTNHISAMVVFGRLFPDWNSNFSGWQITKYLAIWLSNSLLMSLKCLVVR